VEGEKGAKRSGARGGTSAPMSGRKRSGDALRRAARDERERRRAEGAWSKGERGTTASPGSGPERPLVTAALVALRVIVAMVPRAELFTVASDVPNAGLSLSPENDFGYCVLRRANLCADVIEESRPGRRILAHIL
jgi:hypothetical protein